MCPDHGGTELLRVPPPGVHDDLVVALGQIPERMEDIAPPLGAMDGPEAIESPFSPPNSTITSNTYLD
jgi:hypothetical protein